MAYDLDGDMHKMTPDDQIRSTNAMLQSVFDTPNGQKYFNDIDSRKDFFNAYANAMYAKGSDVAWPRAAAEVSGDLKKAWIFPTKYLASDEAREWINETGNAIINYRWNDLKKLYQSQAPLTGVAASQWDRQILNKEQDQVQWRYDHLNGSAEFGVNVGAFFVPLLHLNIPVVGIEDSDTRINKGQDQLQNVRNDKNKSWSNN